MQGAAQGESLASAHSPPHTHTTHTQKGAAASPLKTLVDLGAGAYCQAVVPDTSRICLAVGLGFHVECSLEEAGDVAERRRQALQVCWHGCACIPEPHA